MNFNYIDWQTFVYRRVRFLALIEDRSVQIKGKHFENYGSYHSIESFKKMYDKEGEGLNLSIGNISI